MADSKFSEAITSAIESIKSVVGTDTIIGEPIEVASGVTVIPVSKVMVGMATGGMDYIGKHSKETDKANSFSGYGGSGVTVTPVAFLVIKADGDVSLLSINNPQNQANDLGSNVISLLNKTPTIIDKVKSLIKTNKKDQAPADELTVEELDLTDLTEDESAE